MSQVVRATFTVPGLPAEEVIGIEIVALGPLGVPNVRLMMLVPGEAQTST